MSQENKESGEDPADRLSNFTETSTSSTCSSHTTSSGSTGSSGSDNEVKVEDTHQHRDCGGSERYFLCKVGHDECRDHNTQPGRVAESLDSVGHECDNKHRVTCPSTATNTDDSVTDLAGVKKYCECYTNKRFTSPKSKPHQELARSPHNNSISASLLDKSASDRLLCMSKEQCSGQTSQDLAVNTVLTGSSYSNLISTASTSESSSGVESKHTLKPAPSPASLLNMDTNNNKNNSELETIASRRTNFSKSASGSRLINRSRPNVCDCLTQDCGEKKHSNRRQFIEHYYNSRTQLPSANTSSSSFNISTPLNRLSECDAITRRLLSSPIRTTNPVESPTRRTQVIETDKSRRASLGTSSLTDQVFLFAASPFKSMESSYRKVREEESNDKQRKCNSENASSSNENEMKLKQQQGRSLSVCDEETLNPRFRNTSSNHSSNLNRAISLACESTPSTSSRRALTLIPLFGCDIKSLEQFTKLGLILPPVIDSAVDHILSNGINSVGIFRKSGVKSRINILRQKIETNQSLKLDELNKNNDFSIYDVADLIKMWFRELKPVPLMTKELIRIISASLNSSLSNIQGITKSGTTSQKCTTAVTESLNSAGRKQIDSCLKNRIDSITTPTHRALLLRALNFLAQISSRCEINQMTSQNLAICLTPSLCETESDTNSIILDQKALEYCIDNHRLLFGRNCKK